MTTPPLFTANARRLSQTGVTPKDADRAVAIIEHSLADEGPLTRAQLGERISASGIRTAGQALVHILMLACLRGLAVRGPMIGRQHAYALVHDWLGDARPVERDRALAELARRYLAGHGPAEDRDLAKWAGLPLRDARAAIGAIASEVTTDAYGLVALLKRSPAPDLPRPRLLGPYDPLLLGWRTRTWVLGSSELVVATNGLIRGIALVRGRAVATWKMNAEELALELHGRLARQDAAALRADAEDVVRYLATREL